ncbi:MAG TPA: metallophosphoesterase [Vicinamibacteria bacterium]|nr:metallophosphoesterase [Vicinamibacteria bacterium]
MSDGSTLRIAAVGDIHCSRTSPGSLQPLFAEAARQADVLVLCGDLTDYGLPEEARLLVRELEGAGKLPVLAVSGNHDHESGRIEEVLDILRAGGVQLLDGEGVEVGGVGFAGAKGYGGGFGQRAIEPWGEAVTKQFVQEAVREALALESGLARLRLPQRVAVLHYSPIQETVLGDPADLYPFLGSSRLEEPLNRFKVAACFHGHAHRGRPEGRTSAGVPVYNVALPVLRAAWPDRPPLRILELPVNPPFEEQRVADRRAAGAR